MRLQRHSGVPLYRQVEKEIQRRINEDELRAGDRLPTEAALSEELAVNRLTVRHAIGGLVRAGLLQTRHGVGTFVREPPRATDITIDPTQNEVLPAAVWTTEETSPEHVLAVTAGTAAESTDAASALGTGNAPLHRVDTLVAPDGLPWLTSTYWLAQNRFPDLPAALTAHGSPIAALTHHYGLTLRYLWRAFAAGSATPDNAVLDIPPGTPLLLREGLNADPDGCPTVYVQRRCRSDRIRFVLHYDPSPGDDFEAPTHSHLAGPAGHRRSDQAAGEAGPPTR